MVAQGLPVDFRLTLVPGITDGEDNLAAVARFLASMGKHELHLLAYHNMCEAKIDLIAGQQKKLGLPNYASERLREVARWFECQGLAPRFDA
jgi:pyruvate-formate lyase-activating enzyme